MEYRPVTDVPPAAVEYYKLCGFNEEEIKAIAIHKLIINANAFHGKIIPPSKPGGCGCCGCGWRPDAR